MAPTSRAGHMSGVPNGPLGPLAMPRSIDLEVELVGLLMDK